MLSQFTFSNFKSYKNQVTLDMQAISKSGFEDSLLQSEGSDDRFLPVSVIYGPNAGGKSNVLEALFCLVNIVMTPVLIFKSSNNFRSSVIVRPFAFDEVSCNKPTTFEIYFSADDEYEYKYSIKILNEQILEESLHRKKNVSRAKSVMIFERYSDEITLGTYLKKCSINTNVNSQMPYLSFLAINYNYEPIDLAMSWFERCDIINYAVPKNETIIRLPEITDFKNLLISYMNAAGINISDFIISENADEEKRYCEIFFEHDIGEKKYILNINQESEGTQKIFTVLPSIISALIRGSLLVVDELDAKLHPKLLQFIIKLFKEPALNMNKSQLIFTSHDVSVMKSSVFRTDEIWFACKLEDESSELYSLSDIRDEYKNPINADAAFNKQYLEGRYGADPYFTTIKNWK